MAIKSPDRVFLFWAQSLFKGTHTCLGSLGPHELTGLCYASGSPAKGCCLFGHAARLEAVWTFEL